MTEKPNGLRVVTVELLETIEHFLVTGERECAITLERVRTILAQPATAKVDEALAIELPGRLSFCRVADSPIDDTDGDLLDYGETVAAIEAAGGKVKA